ncbi:MAG: 30S ribosomal protein S12 methylthiotransferase RimO [Oscillospiraceae bacterium]|nr:30S ribosomal protein S12 methylthiotransferase RimO [Oscillospiraceae bacterium]
MAAKIGFVSLGCAKNQVNTEQMIYLLQQAGYEILPDPDGADVAVVNTCGFIDSAKSEAIDNILALGELKKAGRLGKILVAGCLSQRYQEEILREMPEVDGILGCGSYFSIVPAVEQALAQGKPVFMEDIDAPLPEVPRTLTTPEHYAYLKIAEGCDNRCSYCVIPFLRGRYRSRAFEDLLEEARGLAAVGVKELIVVAQDISRYGLDLYGKRRLPELLRALCTIEGFHWIRLHYLYPDEITDELIDVIASEPKILKYLDIPIQHVNDEILRRMNRRGDRAFLEALLTKLRERIPGLVLRTSLIAGLPGEGEAEFEELCDFLRRFRLERVGCFAFSPEEGTPAAKMEYPDAEVAQERAEIVAELQSRIMDAFNESRLGAELEVLCEGYDPEREQYFGRSYAESPDIDGNVWFTSDESVPTGSFVTIRVTGTVDGELIGGVLNDDCQ